LPILGPSTKIELWGYVIVNVKSITHTHRVQVYKNPKISEKKKKEAIWSHCLLFMPHIYIQSPFLSFLHLWYFCQGQEEWRAKSYSILSFLKCSSKKMGVPGKVASFLVVGYRLMVNIFLDEMLVNLIWFVFPYPKGVSYNRSARGRGK
jgi:hypothetical protein